MKKHKMLKFITIEGIDGAGKSTTIEMIRNFLESKGERVFLTREPGGTEVGEKLREIAQKVEMAPLTETILMFTARAQHIHEKIQPALEADTWVICDRFTDSTVAYQSIGKGVAENKIRALETLVQDDIKPSLTLILDLPTELARKRLEQTKKEPDRFEAEKNAFFDRVANGYKEIFKKDPNRCKLIDASGRVEETQEQVNIVLEAFYRNFLKENPQHRQMKFQF